MFVLRLSPVRLEYPLPSALGQHALPTARYYERTTKKHLEKTVAGLARRAGVVRAARRRRIRSDSLYRVGFWSRARFGDWRFGQFHLHRAGDCSWYFIFPMAVLLAEFPKVRFCRRLSCHAYRAFLRRGKLAWQARLEKFQNRMGSQRRKIQHCRNRATTRAGRSKFRDATDLGRGDQRNGWNG